MGRVRQTYCSLILFLGVLASAPGCATLMATARPDWNYTDPPYLDPSAQPLVAPTPQEVARPIEEPPAASPLPPAEVVPDSVAPGAMGEPLEGPQLTSPTSRTAVELNVDAPPRKQVGSGIEFRVQVRNPTDQPLSDVAVDVEFDEALRFPGSGEQRVAQSLGRLAPGEAREVTLTLVAGQTGTQCVRITVTVAGTEAAWKSVCVEIVPKQLSVEIVGPPSRTAGSRAEFNIKLVNQSPEVLSDVQTSVRYDAALTPREGSAGAQQKPGRMLWNLGDLQPGEGVQLQIEFECRVPAESACLEAEVTGSNLPAERLEKCLKVIPPRGSVDVQVLDRLDPLKIGDETEYAVTVQNRDLLVLRNLQLRTEIPAQLEILGAEVRQRDELIPVEVDTERRAVTFEQIDGLMPDAVLTYHIRVKATGAGDGAFIARLTHDGSAEPIEVVEPTTVIRP